MSEVEWQTEVPTGNLLATYRGIRIVVRLDSNGNPFDIGWFIGGHVGKSMPVSCDPESAKILGTAAVDASHPE
jgi:hypothetical protein